MNAETTSVPYSIFYSLQLALGCLSILVVFSPQKYLPIMLYVEFIPK